jgi:flagellar assembly protein FliH
MIMFEALITPICITEARMTDSGFRPMAAMAPMVATEAPSPEVDLYATGFAAGQQMATESFAIERAGLMQLIASAEALRPEPSEELAVLISEAVERLVRQIIGNAPIDRDWLGAHAKRAADMVAECDAARTMWVHPDDLELIDSNQIGLTLMPDPAAQRGSIRIDCSSGWIEHGTALYLEELRSELGLGGQSA